MSSSFDSRCLPARQPLGEDSDSEKPGLEVGTSENTSSPYHNHHYSPTTEIRSQRRLSRHSSNMINFPL